ncbi:MAG: hypothetical protein CL955_10465 [Erythrobacteraceae bacterium]|nr:hypothetical protein [Erythrobacteraceae bacterium]
MPKGITTCLDPLLRLILLALSGVGLAPRVARFEFLGAPENIALGDGMALHCLRRLRTHHDVYGFAGPLTSAFGDAYFLIEDHALEFIQLASLNQ